MRILLWIVGGVVTLALLLLVYALLTSNVDPIEYEHPPSDGLTGFLAPNDALKSAEKFLQGVGTGPEDIAVGVDGWFYTGYRDGRIVRFKLTGEHEEFANTGGYPLGMRIDSNNNLIVADADKGLLSIAQSGAIEVLLSEIDGVPMKFPDGLDIAMDGTIWFTDASTRHGHENVVDIFLEGRATGRLISFNPETREATVHLEGLYFANGVAVDPAQHFVLVSETSAYRIRRYWIGKGSEEPDYFLEDLPAIPDNISVDIDGFFWVGFPSLRSDDLDALGDKPLIRKVLGAIPHEKWAPPANYAFVAAFDRNGSVVQNMQQQGSAFSRVTGAVRVDDKLLLTNLESDSLGLIQ